MKKKPLLLAIISIIILSGCTTTLTDPGSDTTTDVDTHTTIANTSYFYPEDTLYAYFAQHTTLGSGENIAECYALRENNISLDDVTAGLYTGIETDIDPSLWMGYSVSEIHNDNCRGGAGDPQTSPTIGRFIVVGGDVHTEDPETGGYMLVAEDLDNIFRKNQHIYPLDASHRAEKRIFDYLQQESDLLTGESAQHCFWLSDYETSAEQISQEIFSPLPGDQLEALGAFTAHRSQNTHCRGGEEIQDESSGWGTFAVIGDMLYRQLRGDEIDMTGGAGWTLIK